MPGRIPRRLHDLHRLRSLSRPGSKSESVPILVCVLVYAWFADKSEVFDAVPAYFYGRNDLQTPITFDEARRLSFLFAGDADGQWYRLTETRKLPEGARKQYLFDAAARTSSAKGILNLN
ncbi:MAG: hypothetical protein ABI967_14745 [bacterium]